LKKEYEASSRPKILAEKLRRGVGVAVRSDYLAADLRAVELDVAFGSRHCDENFKESINNMKKEEVNETVQRKSD
jgi:hypothetical protein